MDFDFIANIASVIGVMIAIISSIYAWWKYRKKRKKEGEDRQNQNVSGSQIHQYSAKEITVIQINNGNSDTSEAIQPLLKKSTEEKTSIPLQTDETVSDLKERNQQDEISEPNNSFSDYDLTRRLSSKQISQLLGQILASGEIISQLSKYTAEQLIHKRQEWQEGHKSKVMQWLEGLKNSTWYLLLPEVKADVLIFEAEIELKENGNITRARELVDKAQSLMPSQNLIRIRAMIVYYEEGPEKAIGLLDNQDDLDSLNLKSDFLIELGRVEEAFEILNFGDESDGEA